MSDDEPIYVCYQCIGDEFLSAAVLEGSASTPSAANVEEKSPLYRWKIWVTELRTS